MKVCLGPQVPPRQFGGATQSGPKSAYWNPYHARLHQKHTKFMEGVDHRITHLHRSFQLQLRGCGGRLRPSSPGSRGRRGGSASRHPRCPPWPPDGCARLGTRAQPLGSCWKVARLVNRDTQIATPSRTGKPEIKKLS